MKHSSKIFSRFSGPSWITIVGIIIVTSSCGSLEQWSQGLQTVSDSLSGSYYVAPTTTYSTSNLYPTSIDTEKEWHNCSSCSGTGRCRACDGSGKDECAKNGRCGVCRGNGKCVGCEGKGGRMI